MDFCNMVTSIRDLKCWRKAKEMTSSVYILTQNLKDYELRNQLRRAALSVMNNIAEGFGRRHDKEMIRFFEISMSSCHEIESMTYLIQELKLFETDQIIKFRESVIEIYKMTSAFALTIKRRTNQTL
jgi:four helix bundle protein